LLGGARRLCRTAGALDAQSPCQALPQPLERELAVAGLAARILGDRRHARAGTHKQAFPLLVGERARGLDIEDRLHARGGHVRVLAARAGGAARSQLDLRERDLKVIDAKRVFHVHEDDDVLIAVIADTHLPRGRREIPPRCLELMRRSDLILHAGDVMSVEALAQIESLGPPVVAVRGNMDSPELVRRLPEQTTVEAEGTRIAMLHDAGPARGRLERLRARFPDADAVVFGHSHMPLHEREDDFQIFNPGSPTERRRAPAHTMGIATAERGALSFELVTL
jgi:uncharacterized protein